MDTSSDDSKCIECKGVFTEYESRSYLDGVGPMCQSCNEKALEEALAPMSVNLSACQPFDWTNYRRECAKDFMAALLSNNKQIDGSMRVTESPLTAKQLAEDSTQVADALISELQKREKTNE